MEIRMDLPLRGVIRGLTGTFRYSTPFVLRTRFPSPERAETWLGSSHGHSPYLSRLLYCYIA